MNKYLALALVISLLSLATAIDIENPNPGDTVSRIVNLDAFVDVIESFLDLSDTPSTYSGNEDFCVLVNSAGDGLDFVNCTIAGGDGQGITGSIGPYLFNNTITIFFNETQLNLTIDNRVIPDTDTHVAGSPPYLFNDTTDMFFNDTFNNITTDNRISLNPENFLTGATGGDLFVNLTGDTMTGNLNMSFNNITNVDFLTVGLGKEGQISFNASADCIFIEGPSSRIEVC